MIWTTYLVKNKQKLKLWVGIMNLNSNVLIFFFCLFSFTSMYVMNSFSLLLTYLCVGISCLDHLLHGDFPTIFISSFDSDVVEINVGIYFSNAKGRILLLGIPYITIYCGVNSCSFLSLGFFIWPFSRHDFHGFFGWCFLV